MTLDGTNTWVLAEPGSARALVVDPGPLDTGHLSRVEEAVRTGGRTVGLVLCTHGHPDHTDGAAELAERTGAPLRPLGDAGDVELDGLVLRGVPTPGHTADSVCWVVEADRALLSGDTVLGRGTAVVAHPDGSLGPYLSSLRRLRELVAAEGLERVLPGHGPVLDDAVGVIDGYVTHRAARLDEVRAALAGGARTAEEVVAVVYGPLDPVLIEAATRTVRATLEHLARLGGTS
jgi:glyoxylase-like metal-dependent hydrolase (beta-lactamase superfamily II)